MAAHDNCSFDEIKEILVSQWGGVNRYNPQTLNLLESCLNAQLDENEYDLEVNLTILKLYQLNGNLYNKEVASRILLKCLMALPKPDIILAKSLIDQVHMSEDPVKLVLELSDLLEGCNFGKVWELLNTHKNLIDGIEGFVESIRDFICHVINITYQNISFQMLKLLLGGLSDEEVLQICLVQNWQVAKNGDMVHVYNHEATVKSRNIEEKIDFSNVQDILRSVA
uniref:Eukaryotic translation initiation factor 3 subunit K n=1 Tax=Romanomermis culicivorax TaxID=13658 RepID=A0A915JNY4_ROMCU